LFLLVSLLSCDDKDTASVPELTDTVSVTDSASTTDTALTTDTAPEGPCIPPGGATVDYTVLPEPAVTLPAAGDSFVDPTFGTTIIRVTDAAEAGGPSTHGYSYWPVFNSDSTLFFLNKAGTPTLYSLDPESGATSELGPLFPSGVSCGWEDAAWSRTDPHLMYCHDLAPKRLYTWDVRAKDASGLTLLHDFDGELSGPSDRYLWQMLADKSDEVFTLHTRDDSGTGRTVIVYERSTDTVHLRDYGGRGLDETHVDHGGDRIVVLLRGLWEVWDFRADTIVTVEQTEEQRGGLCHQAAGTNRYVGGDCWETGFLSRPLDDPHNITHLVSTLQADGVTEDWTHSTHLSLNQWDERYFVASMATGDDGEWSPWEQEIVAVSIHGDWVVRLAHHHSDWEAGGYYAEPRVSMSYDGRYAAFTSNFDGLGQDVYLLKMPLICEE